MAKAESYHETKLYYYVRDNGDGSYRPLFFSSQLKMKDHQKVEEKNSGYYLDSDGYIDLCIHEDGTVTSADIDEVPELWDE